MRSCKRLPSCVSVILSQRTRKASLTGSEGPRAPYEYGHCPSDSECLMHQSIKKAGCHGHKASSRLRCHFYFKMR
eukprot:scaffold200477_cov32-Prasinocladus_malaysianus.AAC.1